MKTRACLMMTFSLAVLAVADAPAAGVPGYVSVQAAAARRGLECRWDPIARLAALSGPSGSARFRPGSAYCLLDGRLQRLSAEAVYSGGSVWIPLSAEPLLAALSPAAAPSRLTYATVAVDAGHGGKDFGAVSPSGTREKDLVLDVAERVRARLEAAGVHVVMTRRTDEFVPLAERVAIARRAKTDLFLSLHANASTTSSLQGFEVYVLSGDVDDLEMARQRAGVSDVPVPDGQPYLDKSELRTVYWDLVRRQSRRQSGRLAREIVEAVDGSVVIARRRLRPAQFHVLKWTDTPALLVEIGYLTNDEDERRLRDDSYRQSMADAIARAVTGESAAPKGRADGHQAR